MNSGTLQTTKQAVAMKSIWFKPNSPPAVDQERFATWDPELEAVPPGKEKLPGLFYPRGGSWDSPC